MSTASPVDFERYGDYTVKASRGPDGSFERPLYRFRSPLVGDPGRYHLYVSLACPWAHRVVIVRSFLGLEDAVSLSVVDPLRDGRGWAFREGDGHGPDPVNGFALLREAYEATEPGYDGHVSVPVLWDRVTGTIASNHFPSLTLDLAAAFGRDDLYPPPLRAAIDELNDHIYATVNNGVYRCGFATTQYAYDEALAVLWESLESLERRLADNGPYLLGPTLTEADLRLWVTLVRFDSVYATHFKCGRRRLVELPSLWRYTCHLYSHPAFGGTTDLGQIKRHYFGTHPTLNPTRIIPSGPVLDWPPVTSPLVSAP
ncbi:MAG TPA: glutathione S-transferase C-terminal domain-containing protein [Pseudonocardiaceae bacterium]